MRYFKLFFHLSNKVIQLVVLWVIGGALPMGAFFALYFWGQEIYTHPFLALAWGVLLWAWMSVIATLYSIVTFLATMCFLVLPIIYWNNEYDFESEFSLEFAADPPFRLAWEFVKKKWQRVRGDKLPIAAF
ncbi:MAG TPA: hypothetical protein VK675_04135 [Candidatus Paceibacterota bacterium]|nr:hypothetical protein [Candidatus Paceibacterota bacterium]